MKPISVNYTFHPVGQGLFCSGQIRNNTSQASVTWVYDCGATTAYENRLIDNEIELLRHKMENKAINLLFLSHFDKDHISGIIRLLGKFKVERIILPYIPLENRLAYAFDQGVLCEDSLIDFYINPARYLINVANQEGDKVFTKIILVPVSEGKARESEEARELNPNDELIISLEESDSPGDMGDDTTVNQITTLKINSTIRCGKLWEFIPYNQNISTEITNEFLKLIRNQRDKLLNTQESVEEKVKALSFIKKEYDRQFGKSDYEKNRISLFLYAGLSPLSKIFMDRCNCSTNQHKVFRHHRNRCRCNFPCDCRHTCHHASGAILYTGDGYLKSDKEYELLKNFLSPNRMDTLCILQVMHHGSKGNWHKGLASKINPCFSVFSSNPNAQYGHPHLEVLRDFIHHGPIQVDQEHGAEFDAHVWF